MLKKLKTAWKELKKLEPGKRFQTVHRRQRDKPLGYKIAFFALAFVAFAVGVVLVFIPGPAVVFFALAGALLSTQSRWVAQMLDRGEVWGRKTLRSLRAWWRRKHPHHGPPRKPRHAGS